MAAMAWVGARLAFPVPVKPATALLVAVFFLRRPKLLLLAVFAVASALGSNAEQNYQPVQPSSGTVHGRLVTDARPLGFQTWRAELRTASGERLLVRAAGPVGWALSETTAGDLIEIEGTTKALAPGDWYRSRHLVGSLSAREIRSTGGPPWWQWPAEWLRRSVARGGRLIGGDGEALYAGLVIGDDRLQPASQQATFRAVGLAHLLAVSGQNVAFALAVAGPLLGRLDLRPRFGATLMVLAWFAVATRLEPSVIRATITAGIAAWSVLGGSRAGSISVLAMTIAGAVILDPFLVYSVGFSLSVLASAGIIVGSPLVEARLRGPKWLTAPMALTISAQVAVAPLLVGTFGPVSLASVPANVASGWAAGLVMAWGLSGGVLAQFVPESLGRIIQAPVGWLVWWIDWVATLSWRLRLPLLSGSTMFWAIALATGAWMFRYYYRILRLPIYVAIVVLLIGAIPPEPVVPLQLDSGAHYWPATKSTASVLIVDARNDERLVNDLVEKRVLQLDYLILTKGNRSGARLAREITRVTGDPVILAPPQHVVPGARRILSKIEIRVGGGSLVVVPASDQLDVHTQSG